MIATLTLDEGDFTLDDEGKWSGPDELLTLVLNTTYSPDFERYAGAPWGRSTARRAQESLGGELTLPPLTPLPAGAVS